MHQYSQDDLIIFQLHRVSTSRKISDILTSTYQKLLKSVEICLSSDKNNFA